MPPHKLYTVFYEFGIEYCVYASCARDAIILGTAHRILKGMTDVIVKVYCVGDGFTYLSSVPITINYSEK